MAITNNVNKSFDLNKIEKIFCVVDASGIIEDGFCTCFPLLVCRSFMKKTSMNPKMHIRKPRKYRIPIPNVSNRFPPT